MTPKLRRVLWFPVSKTPKGEIIYGHKELRLRDLSTAITVLQNIANQIDDFCLSRYAPPVRLEEPLPSEQIIEILRKQLKDLDITFGLK